MKSIHGLNSNIDRLINYKKLILYKGKSIFNFCEIVNQNTIMRFINYDKSKQQFFIDSRPIPGLKKNQCLIKVKSFGVNRADLLFKAGKYPITKEMSDIMGLEFAGYLVDDFGRVDYNKKYMSILPAGGYAEFVSVNKNHLIEIPPNISLDIAGGIPEVFITAFQLLRFVKQTNNLNPGSNILVHGAASGVGTTLIQMINKIYNSNSICLCSENKVDYLKKLGANFVMNRKAENKVQMIREYLNLNSKNNKLNAVLDHVGKDEFQNNIDLLGTDSCYISYGTVSGSTIKILNLRDLLFKRISFIFSTLASRSDDYKTDLINEFKSEILPNLENGDLKLIVHKNLPFSAESMHLAHQILENNENIGKIIINI